MVLYSINSHPATYLQNWGQNLNLGRFHPGLSSSQNASRRRTVFPHFSHPPWSLETRTLQQSWKKRSAVLPSQGLTKPTVKKQNVYIVFSAENFLCHSAISFTVLKLNAGPKESKFLLIDYRPFLFPPVKISRSDCHIFIVTVLIIGALPSIKFLLFLKAGKMLIIAEVRK